MKEGTLNRRTKAAEATRIDLVDVQYNRDVRSQEVQTKKCLATQ
jgi:hypothetical protein